ncbi:MAG: hypothetical protein AAGL17_22780 [Cyanobacteria bacterium J06576_12]
MLFLYWCNNAIVFCIIWNLFVVAWQYIAFSTGLAGLFISFVAIPHTLIGIALILQILYILCCYTVLTIYEQSLTLNYRILGRSFKTYTAHREYITKLEKKRTGYDIRSNYPNNQQLIVQVGSQSFSLNTDHLTAAEARWLMQELSEWLGMHVS